MELGHWGLYGLPPKARVLLRGLGDWQNHWSPQYCAWGGSAYPLRGPWA